MVFGNTIARCNPNNGGSAEWQACVEMNITIRLCVHVEFSLGKYIVHEA